MNDMYIHSKSIIYNIKIQYKLYKQSKLSIHCPKACFLVLINRD